MKEALQTSRPTVRLTDHVAAKVGNTRMVQLRSLTAGVNPRVSILAKAEWENPSGSVKDRAARSIIGAALASGELGAGRRLLDSTSGNMGISYASLAATLRIPVTLTVPASASAERLTVLKALGADVILTDPLEGSDGALLEAQRLAAAYPDTYWYARQYENPANWRAHFESTGPEIVRQTDGKLTHFVAGIGTSGTLVGTGSYLKRELAGVTIVGVQPDQAFHGIEGLKHINTAIRPAIYDEAVADEMLFVKTEDARAMVRRLAREEGLLVGVSSGAAAAAALTLAQDLDAGVIVTVFPDSGYKYLSDRELWSPA